MSKYTEYVESVASSIIKQLENGTAPWIKPWKPGERYMPYNAVSGKNYQGMNTIWLMSVAEAKGYDDARWMTYKQATSMDAQVNRGEKGTLVQYWRFQDEVIQRDQDGKPILNEAGKPKKTLILLDRPQVKTAVVFNANQITGLSPIIRPVLNEWERHTEAEAILNDSGAKIQHVARDRAFYRPSSDSITLPLRDQFQTADAYYATALHELGHWTGHSSRLNRDLAHPFGSEGYAKEELRAEIASLMLGEQLVIGHDPGQHSAYIKSWIKVLQEDPKEIFRAASDAEKITKYLRGREMNQEQQQTQESQVSIVVPIVAAKDTPLTLMGTAERLYLDVPYPEKSEAKALGAKWDKELKAWYAPAQIDQSVFSRWFKAESTAILSPPTPQAEFAQALQEAGLLINGAPVMNGELQRIKVIGDTQGERSGAYTGFLDGYPAGYIKNYKTGYEANWKSAQPVAALPTEERNRLEKEAAERQVHRAQEREAQAKQTAQVVLEHWMACTPVSEHPYLASKGIQAYGLKVNTQGALVFASNKADEIPQRWSKTGDLMVPVFDCDGTFWSIQSIDATGRKSFPRGSKLQGGHCLIGTINKAEPLLIAEGYATGATLHELTGLTVVVAFNSGNLPAVAQDYRGKHPEQLILIAGDNDHQKPQDKNIGAIKALEAAQRVGGYPMLPDFKANEKGSDWNDLLKLKGLEGAKYRVTLAIETAKKRHFDKQYSKTHTVTLEREGRPHSR